MLHNLFHRGPDGPEDWLVSTRGPIRRERVPPKEAFARWQAHRDAFATTGLWPVIVPLAHIENLEGGFARQGGAVEANVAAGIALDVDAFLARRRAENMDALAADGEEFRPDLGFDPASIPREARPPVAEQIGATTSQLTINGSARGIGLALVPCRAPWEVPAVLGYGGWNACPTPAEHVAVLRHWSAAHGAEPLVVGHDTLELLVRPVEDPAEAKRVATEGFAYCDDVLSQDAQAVSGSTIDLLGASVWLFWWD